MIPTKSEYYGEDYSKMSIEELSELCQQESREAPGFLWAAIQHVKHDKAACELMHALRDELIQDEIDHGNNSTTSRFRTMFLYRLNTVGVALPTFKTFRRREKAEGLE